MTEQSSYSYSILSKKDFKKYSDNDSRVNIYSNPRITRVFYFEHFNLIAFKNSERHRPLGNHKNIEKAVEELITLFKDFKSKEFSRNLEWANKQCSLNVLNIKEVEKLESLITILRKNIKQDSGLSKRAIMSTVQNTPKGELSLTSFLGVETYKQYKEHGQALYDKSSKVYKFSEETSEYLTNGKELLKKNKKILGKLYSKELIDDFYRNINLCLKWCKKPGYLSQEDQIQQLKEVKADLEDFTTRIEKYKKDKIEKKLLSEKESNFKLSGFFETNDERLDRELFEEKKNNNLIKDFINNPRQKFLILEGMAGTGKTENINLILSEIFEYENIFTKYVRRLREFITDEYQVIVSAPSNVAVANIRQRNIYFAKTFQNVTNQINLKSNRYKSMKYLIVDEANMLTSSQVNNLIISIKRYKEINFESLKFIFLGDEGQILPVHHSQGLKEYSSSALSKDFLKKILSGDGVKATLETDYRFVKYSLPKEYIDSVKWLRTEPKYDVITEFLAKNKETGVVEVIKEEDAVINIFNREVSLGTEIREITQNNEKPDFSKLKLRYPILDSVEIREFNVAVEKYKEQRNRRPELGKLYSQIFPSVIDRVENKKQPNLAIILHRSNEQVRETNISIRPYLFPDVNPELIENTPFLEGEILHIESSQFQEDDNYENQVFAGETVVVLNADPLDADKYIDKLYGKFWKLTVKPTFRLDETHLAIFKLNLGLFNRKNKEILVWDGFLNSTISNEDTYKHYKNDLRQASNVGLLTDDERKRKVSKAYAVKYGYSKTNYSAQGGEWNNVILQVSDADWNAKYTNARFLYTAVSRATNNIFFVNS